jgi:hypothetical protein
LKEAIQGADELRGSSYTKHHTTKGIGTAPKGRAFATKNLAFALTTGPRPSAMLRMEGRAIFPLSAEIAASEKGRVEQWVFSHGSSSG